MASRGIQVRLHTQRLDAIHSLPDAFRLSCFTGPSPDGRRFYGVDAGHRFLNGEIAPCILEFERDGDFMRERRILRCPVDYFPVSASGPGRSTEETEQGPVAGLVEAINYLTCGVMPCLGFVVVACCGDFLEDAGSIVIFRPYASEQSSGDCFPVKIRTAASTWSASVCAEAPLLVYGSNAHTVNLLEFSLAGAEATQTCAYEAERVMPATMAPNDASCLPYVASQIRIRCRVLAQHAHNIPCVSFGAKCFALDDAHVRMVASVSLDCTAHWTSVVPGVERDPPHESRGSVRFRVSLGTGGMQRDGGWFIEPIPWYFWHAGAIVLLSPEAAANTRVAASVPASASEAAPSELVAIDTCLDAFEQAHIAAAVDDVHQGFLTEKPFDGHIRAYQETSVWLIGTGSVVSVWRIRRHPNAVHPERIAALDLARDVRVRQVSLFGIRYHAFSPALGILVVGIGMLLPRDGGLLILAVDRWSGRVTRYLSHDAAAHNQRGSRSELQRLYDRIQAPVCAIFFVDTTLYVLDRNRELHMVTFKRSAGLVYQATS
jgi:hypothetical protein